MSNDKMREVYDEWFKRREEFYMHGAEYSLGWAAWKTATAATQRDAMAVAEEIASKCGDVIREFKEIAISYNDTRSKEIANHLLSLLCQKIDLAAIVEAVQPASAQQQGEPVAWKCVEPVDVMPHVEFTHVGAVASEFRRDGWRVTELYTVPPAPACSVPDKMDADDGSPFQDEYAQGWNDCRAAVLAAAPKPEGGDA